MNYFQQQKRSPQIQRSHRSREERPLNYKELEDIQHLLQQIRHERFMEQLAVGAIEHRSDNDKRVKYFNIMKSLEGQMLRHINGNI